jgi:hypothetical protein
MPEPTKTPDRLTVVLSGEVWEVIVQEPLGRDQLVKVSLERRRPDGRTLVKRCLVWPNDIHRTPND